MNASRRWNALIGIVAAVVVLGSVALRAQTGGEQLYFVAMTAPSGSISADGASTAAVYLRWDVNEGQLPSDLAGFVVERDGVAIASMPAAGPMDAAAIAALYSAPGQDRRRAEMVRWLDAEDPDLPVDANNFAQRIAERIDPTSPSYDPVWSSLAARIDFNVARARQRALLDTTATGVHLYTLVGESVDGSTVQLGQASTDASQVQTMPAAAGFRQTRLTRCDLPGQMRDHGSVALDWAPAGANASEQYLDSLLVAGYDLYRTDADATAVDPTLDLRALAFGQPHGSDGRVTIAGLEQVNDQPILISGGAEYEQTYDGWNPEFSQFVETLAELDARGVTPGSSRAYYLVPRDFTGNYGATASLLVTVPDTLAPPAPWGVEGAEDAVGDALTLVWEHVDVNTYHARFPGGRTYCNLDTARFDSELRWVVDGELCGTDAEVRIDLDVTEYLVYRFDDADAAARFEDSDGDGFSDLDERAAATDGVGDVCDADLPDPIATTLTSFRVGTIASTDAVVRPDGRRVLEFADPIPSATPGAVYWYRIVARDADGNLGAPSEPVRGFVPDRTRPSRDELDDLVIGERVCKRHTEVDQVVKPDQPFAIDTTEDGAAAYAVLSCDGTGGSFEMGLPIETLGDLRGAELSARSCQAVLDRCGYEPVQLTFHDRSGEVLGDAVDYYTEQACPLPSARLVEDCTDPDIIPIPPGGTTEGEIEIDYPGAEHCVHLYREIAGGRYRIRTVCPGEWPVVMKPDNLGGDSVCLSAALSNENAVSSSKLRLPCFHTEVEAPSEPTPVELKLTAGSEQGAIAWLPPEQPTIGTVVQWYQNDGDGHGSHFFPHAGRTAQDGEVTGTIELGPEPVGSDWQQSWCFRARAIGYTAPGSAEPTLSDWSPELCEVRLPASSTPPTYLPWPHVPEPPSVEPVEARYLGTPDDVPLLLMSEAIDFGNTCEPVTPVCTPGSGEPCMDWTGDSVMSGCTSFCAEVRSAAAGSLGFVAYRQSRADATDTPTAFHQVSPLIDTVFCEADLLAPRGSRLADPYIGLVEFPGGDVWAGSRLVYRDLFPHQRDLEYRYQLVYFDANGEITSYRTTDWIVAQ